MAYKNDKKYPTRSVFCLPGRLTKDPEVKQNEANDPEAQLVKLTVVDSTGSSYHDDLWVTATFRGKRGEVMKKLRKGDFVTLIGKLDVRAYLKGQGKKAEPCAAGDMFNPDCQIQSYLGDREAIDAGEAEPETDAPEAEEDNGPVGVDDDIPF